MGTRSRDERGVALPLAMILMAALLALTVSFSSLSTTEPVIANNHQQRTQARGMADSGLEWAIWGLNKGTVTSPYTGTFTQVISTGGFVVTLTNGTAGEVNVDSVGWVPNTSAGSAKAHITATVTSAGTLPPIWNTATCTLCVLGTVSTGGNSSVNASADTSCGNKYGVQGFGTNGTATIQKSQSVTSPLSPAYVSNADVNTWNTFALTATNLSNLKSLARQNGTYYQGSFSGPLPNGLVFVDTVSGNPMTASTPASDLANVSLSGNCCVDSTGFHGWLVVNGNITISGNGTYYGVIYAVEDFSIAGSASIQGLVVAANLSTPASSSVDASDLGTSAVTLNCTAAKAKGYVPGAGRWSLKTQTYAEIQT